MTVGIDTVEIERIKELINKELFLESVFSEVEIKEFSLRNNKPEHIAAAFASKEAFSKAIGTGVSGFKLTEISLLHLENGKPYLKFSGNALSIVDEKGLSFDVSVTHTNTLATVVVVGF